MSAIAVINTLFRVSGGIGNALKVFAFCTSEDRTIQERYTCIVALAVDGFALAVFIITNCVLRPAAGSLSIAFINATYTLHDNTSVKFVAFSMILFLHFTFRAATVTTDTITVIAFFREF